jgi:hypothetical protein
MLWDPNTHFINAGATGTLLRTAYWLVAQAPPDIKQLTFGALSDFGPMKLLTRNRTATT